MRWLFFVLKSYQVTTYAETWELYRKKKLYKKTFYVYLWYHQQILSGNHMLFGQIPEFHDCYPHILAPQEKKTTFLKGIEKARTSLKRWL